jgi:hypothetical protein
LEPTIYRFTYTLIVTSGLTLGTATKLWAEEFSPYAAGLLLLDEIQTEYPDDDYFGDDFPGGSDGGGEAIEIGEQKLASIRFTALRKNLRKIEDHGWGARLKMKVRFSWQKLETLDDLDFVSDNFKAITLEPNIGLTFPINEHWDFIPSQEIGASYSLDENNWVWSSGTTGAFRWKRDFSKVNLEFIPAIKYGINLDNELNVSEDYLNVSGNFSFYLPRLDIRTGNDRVLRSRFHVKGTYYIKDIQYLDSGNLPVGLNETWEAGIRFGFDPRHRVWKVKIPAGFKLTYIWGEDFKGLKLSFGS